MKSETTQLPGSRVELLVQLDKDDVNAIFADVYKELSRRGAIRGFRPGKAPKVLIRRHYGEDAIRDAAWAGFLQDKLATIVEEAGLDVIESPELPDAKELGFAEDQPLEFNTILTVRPTAHLPEYKGLKLLRPTTEITDDEVETTLGQLQDSFAEEIETERDTVGDGDIVYATVKVHITDQDAEPEEREQKIIVGSGQYDPPIDEKLVGHAVGETVTAEKTLPDEYTDKTIAGKTVTVEATIKQIKTKQLPELSDEFAQKVDAEKYPTLDALKESIREQSREQKAHSAQHVVEDQIVDYLLENSRIEIPESLLGRVTASEWDAFMKDLQRDGLTLESALEVSQMTEEESRARIAQRAEQTVKVEMITESLIESEKIEASAAELELELEAYAKEAGLDPAFVRQAADVQDQLWNTLRQRVLRHKAVQAVVDAAEIEDVPEDTIGARLAAIRAAKEAGVENQTAEAAEPSYDEGTSDSQEHEQEADD